MRNYSKIPSRLLPTSRGIIKDWSRKIVNCEKRPRRMRKKRGKLPLESARKVSSIASKRPEN